MRKHISRPCALVLVAAAGLSVAGIGSAQQEAARAVPPGTLTLTGEAYGTFAIVGRTAKSDKTAPVNVGGPCTFNDQRLPIHRQDSVARARIASLDTRTGVIETTADASESNGTVAVRTTATAHDVSLLDGLIRATEVRAASETSYNGSAFGTSAAGSTFVDLVIAGEPIEPDVPPNTRIALPGLGVVVLNEQRSREDPDSAALTVNMIHVRITEQNQAGYEVGTNLFVAHAQSGIKQHEPVIARLDGNAYGTWVRGEIEVPGGVDIGLNSGRSAYVAVSCDGTDGHVKSDFVASVDVPSDGSVLEAGTIRTTAEGDVGETSAHAKTTARVEGARVLGDVVRASLIKAAARAELSGGEVSLSHQGSGFGTLEVEGHPEIGPDVEPNTKVELAGLGTLWLYRVQEGSNAIRVTMIELDVTVKNNDLDLAVGTIVRIAAASASAHEVR
jgi:hypothetical protein